MRLIWLASRVVRIPVWHNVSNGNSYAGEPGLRTPRPATGVSRALRARSVPGVSPRVPRCPTSPFAPRSGVSKRCPESVPTFLTLHAGTLSGHFLDTTKPGAPSDTPSDTRRFRGHSRGHSGDNSAQETPVADRGVRKTKSERKSCSHCNFQEFRCLSKENQVSLVRICQCDAD